MKALNNNFIFITTKSPQDIKTLVWPVVCSEPPRRLGDDPENEQHWNDERALEYDRYSPGVAAGMCRQCVVDPVDEKYTEVER